MAGETQAADATANQVQDDDLDADFEAGFDGVGKGTTETPDAQTSDTEQAAREAAQAAATAAASTQATQPAQAATTETPSETGSKKVEVDEAELQALRERASNQTAAYQQSFDKAFGQIGALKQAIEKLRTETPAGEKVEVSEADFKELVDAYPEIGKLTAQGLNKAMAKLRGTGGADAEAIEKMVSDQVAERLQVARTEMGTQVTDAVLNGIIPRWRQQVNTPAFDAWLKEQKAEVQALAESNDLSDAADMLRRYRRHVERPVATPAPTAAPAQGQQRGNTRQRQIAAAVSTRGDGAATSGSPAEDDDFSAGFKAGKV